MDELKPTTITLQLEDRSVKRPIGILEDEPIKVDKFFILVDFVVMEIEEDFHIPIILGRLFLATIGAIINVKNGKLSLTVWDDKVEFDLANTGKKSFVEGSYCKVDMFQQIMRQEMLKHYSRDPLERCLVCDKLADVEDDESGEYACFLEAQPCVSRPDSQSGTGQPPR